MANLLSIGMTKIKAEDEVAFMAYYDSLTMLPNRRLFEKNLEQKIERCQSKDLQCSVIFLDLDGFKSVNDTIGHKGGDQLLIKVAKRLKRILGPDDIIARFGGDEFLILVNSFKCSNRVKIVADELLNAFITPFNVSNQDFFITCSAGIAVYLKDGTVTQSLIKNADIAMYSVKYSGKNKYAFCTEKMKADVYSEMLLSNDLNNAIERDQLEVFYQPQINLCSKKIIGVEALLRWNHPELGIIAPGVFIPLAEKIGLINSIGPWILKQACAKNKSWQNLGFAPVTMAVNLSGVQFMNKQIVNQVEEILQVTGLDAKYLELEITESTAIQESDDEFSILVRLKNLGVSIAIDDFGTEYSSLSRLKNLPIDRLKIDIQFIQGIGKNKKDEAITNIIIELAKSLQLKVIAEGVENLEQVQFLESRMCHDVQGYHFYPPMNHKDVDQVMMNLLDDSMEISAVK